MCHCASNVRERNRGARPSVSSRDLKKRSRDFSDSQKSNFGVRSSSHTASSLQNERRLLKDFFLSLSSSLSGSDSRLPRVIIFTARRDDEKFLARKKTKERSERRHMRDLDIKKERKRGIPRSTSPCSPRSKRRTDPDTRPLPPLFFCFAPP